jgi:hypothetical protein
MSKRRRRIWIVVVAAAAGIAAVFALGAAYVVLWWHPFSLGEATKYAPGYSQAKFKQVKIGMTIDEVTKLVGQPLDVTYEPEHNYAMATPDWRKGMIKPGTRAKLGMDGKPIVMVWLRYGIEKQFGYGYNLRCVGIGTDGRVVEKIAKHIEGDIM